MQIVQLFLLAICIEFSSHGLEKENTPTNESPGTLRQLYDWATAPETGDVPSEEDDQDAVLSTILTLFLGSIWIDYLLSDNNQ